MLWLREVQLLIDWIIKCNLFGYDDSRVEYGRAFRTTSRAVVFHSFTKASSRRYTACQPCLTADAC